LQDGTVLYYLGHRTEGGRCVISAFFGSYRFFYARSRDPSLRIPSFPLAVSGICVDESDNVLIGLRKNVTEHADCFEFVPSGGLSVKYAVSNSISFTQQLLDEFEEETGLERQIVHSIEPLGLVVDTANDVFDICCCIRVREYPREELGCSDEYHGLELVKFDEVQIQDFIPTSRALGNLFIDNR
jgi:hypothetical protein